MRTRLATALIIALVLGALGTAGCSVVTRLIPSSATPIPPAASQLTTATNLGAVEINSYRGKKLDAVGSEPENSIKGPQHIDVKTYRLGVSGLVKTPLSLTYGQVTAMPAFQKVTTLNCVEGWSVTYLWTGAKIKDILEQAGYDHNAKVVIFKCYDGYTTSLPLDFIVNRNILLAYKMNGVVMPPERGFPFQVVAEDQLGYKWAKWVTDIQVSNDTNYRGYWEQRGYENSATVPGTQ
ncbi:MAG: molybdopterin-dependent oxidoreductase [Coriobacteriia bacterium]|nr:molybdopterin-dependent oxidoreductase [Coriobacteriia bacterium]